MALASFAAEKTTPASPVIIVDQFSGYDANRDNRDGIHPGASGARKMADRFFTALVPLLMKN